MEDSSVNHDSDSGSKTEGNGLFEGFTWSGERAEKKQRQPGSCVNIVLPVMGAASLLVPAVGGIIGLIGVIIGLKRWKIGILTVLGKTGFILSAIGVIVDIVEIIIFIILAVAD